VPLPFRRFATALAVLLGLSVSLSYAADRNVRGVVTDESNGVLPGVTIVATAADGRVLATAVTDGAGRYRIGPLAAGRVTLTFQLEGFSQAAVPVTIAPDADAVVSQRLVMAPRSETVVVIGKVPVPPPPLPPPPAPKPRPRPVTRPVPEHDRDSICGPARLSAKPESFGTVRSRRYAANELYSVGDELVVEGGTRDGLEVGRNFVVRRTYRIGWDPRTETGEHTAGLVQIVNADEQTYRRGGHLRVRRDHARRSAGDVQAGAAARSSARRHSRLSLRRQDPVSGPRAARWCAEAVDGDRSWRLIRYPSRATRDAVPPQVRGTRALCRW
jgi:Carboxypeptidase regulatory-like domain